MAWHIKVCFVHKIESGQVGLTPLQMHWLVDLYLRSQCSNISVLSYDVTPSSTILIFPFIFYPSMPEKKGIFPKTAMMAVACASFMDSFCFQIIVPNLPFAVQKWFPNVPPYYVA